MMNNWILRIFFVATCVSLASPALALSTDRDQPAQIVADDIEFDFNTGVRTYTGNVSIVQGTLRITADKLVAHYNKDGALENATAWGNLASFRQRPDDKDTDTIGKGREIIIDEVANTLTLITTASLTQGPNTATGAKIIYDMATDKLKIQGGGGGARINTAGKDGSTLPPAPPPAPVPDKTVSSIAPTESGTTPESDGECIDEECDKPAVKASIPGLVDISVSPTGRSRIVIQPKSNPAPATTARVDAAAYMSIAAAEEKLAAAIESEDPEAVDEAKEKLIEAINAVGKSVAAAEEKLAAAIESEDPEAVEEAQEKLKDAIDAAGESDTTDE
jgi:lipopolysaccharide export system protein LptA